MRKRKQIRLRDYDYSQSGYYFVTICAKGREHHIIRSERSLESIREYIQNNPLKWDLDRENPSSKNFNLDHDDYWKEIYDPAWKALKTPLLRLGIFTVSMDRCILRT